jgi:hypothetical protein
MDGPIARLKRSSFSLFFIRRKQIEPNKADQTYIFAGDRKGRTTAA